MSAAQIFGAVRAAAPNKNPFSAIAYTLREKLYSPNSETYMRSIVAWHVLYAIQAVLLIAALLIRLRRNRGDVWLFRMTSTARGSFITPHFAVAWQVSSLAFCIILQPYMRMTYAHATGHDWPGFLAGRTSAFLLAWLSTWLALWSLAVAVSLPRSGGSRQQRFRFLSSPTFINVHFLLGIVLCCASILIPSFICSTYYDAGVDNFRRAYALLGRYAPAWASMTPAEVDAALAEVVPIVQDMLENLSTFPHIFGIAWTFWLIWIVYSYGVFLIVAVVYFGYIRRSMKRVGDLDNKLLERASLQRSWLFAVFTSVLVTATGLVYGGAAAFIAIWTDVSLNKQAIEIETHFAQYGFGILGLFASVASVAQALVGSSASTQLSVSNDYSRSTKLGGTTHSHVQVHVQTHTEVQSEKGRNVVQLELQDWAHEGEKESEKVRFAEDI